MWSQGSTRDGDRGLGQSEGSGQDLGPWVSRGPRAILGLGGTWVLGKCHLALVAVLPHVLLVAVTVLTFSASLGTEDSGLGIPFGSHPPDLHPTPWTFPQLPTLITSHTELSSFPLVPLLRGDTMSPCRSGLDLWVFSSCLLPVLPTACQAPVPFHPPSTLPQSLDPPLRP